MPSSLSIPRRSVVSALLGLCLAAVPSFAQQTVAPVNEAAQQAATALQREDPPTRVARLSVLNGEASVEPASVDSFSAAELNLPLTTGDRLYTATGATAAVDADTFSVRMGERTDLTVTGLTDRLAQLGLASGAVHLRSWSLAQGTVLELDTTNAALTVVEPGDLRIEADPQANTTTIGVLSGSAQVDAPGLSQTLRAGQWLRVGGGSVESGDSVYAQWLSAPVADGLDAFSASIDSQYQTAASVENAYVSPDMVGADDLTAYGNWDQDADYGAVWFPAVIAEGWQPYRNGRWCWIAPWGWTWIGAERWGFAPYHYGRWTQIRGRWGWVPGPRVLHPVYAPALVAFVGTPGSGNAAWFPLGPREPYIPWYHASPLYENRVNAANLFNRNAGEARQLYDRRDSFAFSATAGTGSYMNRSAGTVAMPEAAFAAGRRADRQGTAGVHPELASAPVLPHPMVNPERGMVAAAPAGALPARVQRPTLASRPLPGSGFASQNRRGSTGFVGSSTTRVVNPAAVTTGSGVSPAERTAGQAPGSSGGDNSEQPLSGTITRYGPPSGAATTTTSRTSEMQRTMPVRPVNPPAGTGTAPTQNGGERPLVNLETPPPARPSFEQQRHAMEQTDPGRPLDPQQMQNLRESRPAGQPTHAEPIPHPAPAARPAPAPRPASPPPAVHSAPAMSGGKH